MLSQGDAKNPLVLNNHIWGPIIKEVHWGGFALFELTYPDDFNWFFLIETPADPTAVPPVIAVPPVEINQTHTVKSFKVGDVIDRSPENTTDDRPIILIRFDEPNPIDEDSTITGFTYQPLFSEWPPLQLFPSVEVIDSVERWRIEDQANVDSFIAAYNVTEQARFDTPHESLQADIIATFLAAHPDGEILRNVTDAREINISEPPGGWGVIDIPYLPLPWLTAATVAGIYTPGGPQVFSYPGWQFNYPHSITGFPPFLPPLVGGVYGKYPNIGTQRRLRDCYAINLSKLGNRIVSLKIDGQTSNTNSSVQLDFFTGGGTWSAATKRTVVSSNALSPPSVPPLDPVSHLVKTTQFANAKDPLDKVFVKFDRHGFVPLT